MNHSDTPINQLLAIMATLRDPQHGCPWDVKQTYQSIVPYTLEEAYEVADAIEQQDYVELKGELGDLLFQVVFYCQIAAEEKRFTFDDVVETLNEKMIRRHPHVFASETAETADEVLVNWEAIKQTEREQQGNTSASILDSVPMTMPALTRAYKLQKKCARVGFDWPDVHGALKKIHEEVEEVEAELSKANVDEEAVADELGDLLFAVVNVVRHMQRDPESVLRKANQKFTQRFQYIERVLAEQGTPLASASLETLDALWEASKGKTYRNFRT